MAETERARPLWLDIDGLRRRLRVHDPDRLLGHPRRLDVDVDARVLDIAGHLHDIDIIDPNPCTTHCAERGGGSGALGRGGRRPGGRLLRPDPPEQPSALRHHGRHAVPLGGLLRHLLRRRATAVGGHLDTMSHCGIFSELPGGRQAQVYPAERRLPARRAIRSRKGQVIRLHSEYQNGSGVAQDGRDGDHAGLAGLRRTRTRGRRRATPMYLRWCRPTAACTHSQPRPRSAAAVRPPATRRRWRPAS